MLHQFTWQQFLIAALILTFSWYLAMVLLYFRDKISDLFVRRCKNKPPERLKCEWEEELEESSEEAFEQNLIGNRALPEGVNDVGMDQFAFATNEKTPDGIRDETNEQGYKVDYTGIDSPLREELESIFKILEQEKATKADFISLFRLVSSKYPEIKNTHGRQVLTDFLLENLPFEMTDEELDKIWI